MSKEKLVSGDVDLSSEPNNDNGDLRMELVALKISYQGLQVGLDFFFSNLLSLISISETGGEQGAQE
jgi:hypothetical protein